jgi:hypothetical protein
MMDGIEAESWKYAAVVVPIVITMSPVGALVTILQNFTSLRRRRGG